MEALKLATATTKTKINQRSRAGRVARFDLPLFGTPLLPPSGSNLQPQPCQCFNRPSLVFDSISSLRKSESSFRSRRTGLPFPPSPLRRGCCFSCWDHLSVSSDFVLIFCLSVGSNEATTTYFEPREPQFRFGEGAETEIES